MMSRNEGKGRAELLVIFCLIGILMLTVKTDCRDTSNAAIRKPRLRNPVMRVSDKTTTDDNTQQASATPCTSKKCVVQAARIIEAMDPSADPCEDFYKYSCGGWINSRILPEDKSSYDRFTEVDDNVQRELKAQLEKPISAADVEAVRKVKTMYQSCVNEQLIEKLGVSVADGLLKDLGGWPVLDASWDGSGFVLEDILVKLALYNNRLLVNYYVGGDDKNSTVNIIVIDQTDLGMPSRDYYLHKRHDLVLVTYQDMATDVAVAFGAKRNAAAQQMKDVVDFEIKLANLTVPAEDRRDVGKLYHRMNVSRLQDTVPGFDWLRYLKGLFDPFNETITEGEEVVVYPPQYLRNMLDLVKKTPKRTLANYLIWRIIQHRVDNMGVQMRQLKDKYNKVMYGANRESPRWYECVGYVVGNLGDATGRVFVDNNFDREAKTAAETMIGYLRTSFKHLLRHADWMDCQTRLYALEKADDILEKIGYPDYILNNTDLNDMYIEMDFNLSTYFENVLTVLRSHSPGDAYWLRRTNSRTPWTTTPAEVNAFYTPSYNAITFPAAVLQPPFYSKDYSMSQTFGGIGVVISHEITHGFDDEGRQYDHIGNFLQWWSNSSIQTFKKLSQCLVDQYSHYVINGDHVNGKLTLGENIADNGGIKASFEAYKKWVSEHGEEKPLPGLDLSHEKIFFIGAAQSWCSVDSPQALHNLIVSDEHSPNQFRVAGMMSNSEHFSQVFQCPKKTKMNPAKKCSIW